MKKANVVLNEQHKLMPAQIALLDAEYESWEIVPVPAAGWTREEIVAKSHILQDHWTHIVFASPVPLLLALCANYDGYASGAQEFGGQQSNVSGVWLMHNDKREKKELPGGKLIQVVAQEGWELVPCH